MTPVRLEPTAPRSRVKHSTTEPLRSLHCLCFVYDEQEQFSTSFKILESTYAPGHNIDMIKINSKGYRIAFQEFYNILFYKKKYDSVVLRPISSI